ncbi:MAG: tetratricopeptide repeat protein [Candidatus Scalinduaceae bacterium]
MSLLQNKKLSLNTTLAFLLVVLLSTHSRVFAETTDMREMAQTLWEQGVETLEAIGFYIRSNEKTFQTALKSLNDSLNLYREIGDRQSEADLLTCIAWIAINSSKFVDAQNYLKESQEIYAELGSKPGEKAAFEDIEDIDENIIILELYIEASSHINDKDYVAALKKYNNLLQLYREMGARTNEADILLWIGWIQFNLRNYIEAEHYFNDSLTIYREIGERQHEADILLWIGRIQFNLKNYTEAEHYFNDSLTIYREVGDRQSEAVILNWIGKIQYDLKNYMEAEHYYRESLSIYRQRDRKIEQGLIFKDIAALYYAKDENTKSLNYINEAIRMFEQTNDKEWMANVLGWAGIIHCKRQEFSMALDYFKKSLLRYQKIKHQEGVAEVSQWIIKADSSLGYFNIPIKYYKQALNIIHEKGNLREEGSIIHTIGKMYSNRGDYKEALKAYDKAKQIFKELNDITNQGNILVNIGEANSNLGNYLQAIDNLKEALEIFEGLKDNSGQQAALNALTDVYIQLGDYERVKEYNLKSLNIVGADKENKSVKLLSLLYHGLAFEKEGRFEMALDVYRQALDLSKEIDDKISEMTILSYIGRSYFELAELSKALEFYRQILKASREQKNKNNELVALVDIAQTCFNQNDFQSSLDYSKQALVIAKEIGNKLLAARCYFQIGYTYVYQNKREKAEEYLEKALIIDREIDRPEDIWTSNFWLGINAMEINYQKAKRYFSEAINKIESIREKISVEEYKTSFIEDKLVVYSFMILTLLLLEEFEEAFNYVERAKSRSLLDLLGNSVKLEKGKDKDLSQEERRLQKKINELLEKIQKEHSQQNERQRTVLNVWNKELEKTRKEYSGLLLKIRRKNPELYSLVNVNPLTLKEVQNLLEPDTTLLEYFCFLGEKYRSELGFPIPDSIFYWVVNKKEYKFYLIETPKLVSRITTFKEKIATLQPDYEKEAEEFYDLLIRPAKPYIKTKRICIVPHFVLHYLPFQALLNVPEFGGLGIAVELRDGIFTVASVHEGMPAYKAGLKSGDKIMAIDGDSTINMSFQEAVVNRLRGKPSTTVSLTIESGETKARKTIKVKRETIAKSSIYSKLPDGNTEDLMAKAGNKPRFLIEEYDIFYVPSASVLRFVLEKRKEVSDKVLAFGNPELEDEDLNLPHAEEEVKKIKASYPETDLYLNERATEEKAKRLSGDYNIIHFASHGELNPKSPLFSCIKMAKEKDEDGRLEVHEIFNLNLENTSLVTLSACETGLGQLTGGDELIGLTRGFIYAGTPSIVASLWSVNDKSTSELMGLFYKNLKTHSKAEALRLAQLEMINGEVGKGIVRGVGGITISKEDKDKPQTQMTVNGSHPFFWAPFILLGDWK